MDPLNLRPPRFQQRSFFGFNAGSVTPRDIISYGGECFFYVTPLNLTAADQEPRTTHAVRPPIHCAADPMPAPVALAWDRHAPRRPYSGIRSVENPTGVGTPLTQ